MLKERITRLLMALVLALLPLGMGWGFASSADDKRAELNEVQSQMQRMQER